MTKQKQIRFFKSGMLWHVDLSEFHGEEFACIPTPFAARVSPEAIRKEYTTSPQFVKGYGEAELIIEGE